MSSSLSTQFTPSGTASSPSSTSTSPGPGSGTNPTQGNAGANTSLYLYTFLATLVLLLAVSSAIVVRSLILRRRHQRMVEEAIRTGTWMPDRFNSTSGRRRRDFGQKPKLWEAWLRPKDNTPTASEEKEKSKWVDIMPFSTAYIDLPTPSPQGPTPSSAEVPVEPVSRPPRFIRPFARRRSPPSPQPAIVSPTADQAISSPSSSPTTAPRPAVRIAVLIAMPSLPHKHHHHGDESELPVVEIGVVEASVEGDVIETPRPDSS